MEGQPSTKAPVIIPPCIWGEDVSYKSEKSLDPLVQIWPSHPLQIKDRAENFEYGVGPEISVEVEARTHDRLYCFGKLQTGERSPIKSHQALVRFLINQGNSIRWHIGLRSSKHSASTSEALQT